MYILNVTKVIFGGCFLIGIFLLATSSQMSRESIKPLPTIDKEFLIVAHIVTEDEEFFEQKKGELDQIMEEVNVYFEPISASFTICEYRMINNPRYEIPSEKLLEEMAVKYKVNKQINMFVFDAFSHLPTSAGTATLGGIGLELPNNSSINISLRNNGDRAVVIAHEIGHYFGLLHTFESGDELVDGSNCAVAGDYICDTPADPYQEGVDTVYVDGNCVFIYEGKDVNGDFYSPMVSNVMSYYPSQCRCGTFTNEQFLRMVNTYTKEYTPDNVGQFVW